ncbi:HAND-domain-containing protein [Boletus edulis BED1]|uniref:HAND-domain-containing protein n=1 Tax=Boletus edulis BED1 TaxID=1328754 RepID=A0AAD4G750_BOLED|nr:HAND-domain-containing protein [Boletus edulis BED1]
MLINYDIEAIIQCGEERSAELNSKYEGLNLEDLSNFKSDSSLQQWEGEDFRAGGRKTLNLNMLSLSKRERKLNYSVNSYFKDTLRTGPSKTEKAPKMPRAPKQIQVQDFQFFDPALAQLQERELAVFKRLNGIAATTREPQGPDDTPEKLEAERAPAQEFIDTAEPLTEEEQVLKEKYTEAGFHDWSRRDFQQFVRALQNYGWTWGRRAAPARDSFNRLVTSAMSVLSALLTLPKYSLRVWLYIRSAAALFGPSRSSGFAAVALPAERATGQYTMTLALLNLVQQLLQEVFASVLTIPPDNQQLRQVKEEVLMRAANFIGRRISSFYANILFQSPPAISNCPFPTLSQAVIDTFLHKAATSTINPLVSAIAASPSILGSLYNARRFGDVRRSPQQQQAVLARTSALRQSGPGFSDSARARVDPVDVLATFVKERDPFLHRRRSLVISPTRKRRLLPLVRIAEHPYEDFSLRSAVWSFISLAVDKAPALPKLLVTGEFIIPSSKGKERENENEKEGGGDKKSKSALEIVTEILGHWKDLWEANSALLASVLHFIHVVWQHGLEHQSVIEGARQNKKFWDQIAAVAREELGPDPDYTVESFVAVDGERQSVLHEAVSAQAYRGTVKSYAIRIIGQDIFLQPAPKCATDPLPKPLSYTQFIPSFNGDDQLNELILEGASSCYDPGVYDRLSGQLSRDFPNLSLDQLQSQDPASQREFCDNFTFSPTLLRSRLQQRVTDEDDVDSIEKQVLSINLNLSLSHAQTAMAEAWQFLLRQMLPFVRVGQGTRPSFLALASTISAGLAQEKRGGDMMATIHGVRLNLMLSVLEVAWFSTTDSDPEPPSALFLGKVSVPFHCRTLLQILYFCVRQCRNLATRAKVVNAGRHLKITGLVEATSNLVVDALRLTFDSARTRLDLDLDRDVEQAYCYMLSIVALSIFIHVLTCSASSARM